MLVAAGSDCPHIAKMTIARRVASAVIAATMLVVGGIILWNCLTSDAYVIKQLIISVFLISGACAVIYSDLTDSDSTALRHLPRLGPGAR